MPAARSALFSLLTLLGGSISASAQSPSSSSAWPLQSFKSSLHRPPYLNVTKMGQTEPGFLFTGPVDNVREVSYPTIYSDDGQLVWQGQLMNISALQPQMLNGEPVIAYWQGYDTHMGMGFGQITILNSSYDEIHKITLPQQAGNFQTAYGHMSSYIDIHESQITDQNTILVTAVNTTRADLTPVGGPKDGWLLDGLFYEIDIETNEVVFHWSAKDHLSEIPMTNNEIPRDGKGVNASDPYAYAHLNSVAKYGDNYLISSRYMCSIFFLDKHGNVIWHLHGRKGADFTLAPDASFCYQHDPRFVYHDAEKARIHFHNNENDDYTGSTTLTTGLELDLDFTQHTANVARRVWNAKDPLYAHSQGSYQNLTNDHVLLYHGSVPVIEEYDETGACVMSAQYGTEDSMQGYRAYRAPWVGRPRTKPSVVACKADQGTGTKVYVSWNGATDVSAWKVYGGSGEGSMKVVKTVGKNGFETKALVEDDIGGGKVMVQAVGGVGDGRMSEVVSIGQGC